MSKIDLHIHSRFSDDGELSVQEIMDKCRMLDMELVSITDHNSVKGALTLLEEKFSFRVLPGVELDCTYKGRGFHLLGYGFDPTCREFSEIENDIFRQEMEAAEEKVSLFRKATGIPVSVDEVISAAGGGIVTGELIAEIVLAKDNAAEYKLLWPYLPNGAKSDMPNVRLYWDFFSPGKPAYVPIRYISLPDAKALIHATNGISVLAHPAQNLSDDYSLLTDIMAEGVSGIEVFSSYHSPEAVAHLLEIAKRDHLLITCGSDFHGKHKPHIQMGGHRATWNDAELAAAMEGWLS